MSAFAGEQILVVGGAGFVGSNLVRRLLADEPNAVVVVDNLLSAESDNLPDHPALRFIEGSINDDRILSTLDEGIRWVFHLATFHGNQSSIADPLADHENNTLTTLKLCERMRSLPSLKKVVYASAGCTVAAKTDGAADATTEDAPVSLYHDSPYQISKIVGELYLNYYHHRYGLPAVKARFQNVYGPGEVLGAGRWRGTSATVWRNVTPTFVYRALKRLSLPIERGGFTTRDFVYVGDIVDGLVACALSGVDGEVYNLASGVETSILQLAETINALTDNRAPVSVTPAREWDRSGHRYGSPEKARRELDFRCRVDLETGLRSTIDWTRENMDRIEHCIDRHRHRLDT